MTNNDSSPASPKRFLATGILLGINVLLFIEMAVSGAGIFEPDTLPLLKWGADYGPLTLTGDWWRTVTCNFVHIGIIHLVMNMYALVYVGLLLELIIGSRRMFVSYLLTGICSAVFSLYMHGDTISAGASGSIFGLYGIFLALLFFHRIEKGQRNALLASILIFVGYNLMNGMKDGIDNAAHIGGLISGFLLGMVYVVSYKYEKLRTQRLVSIAGEFGMLCIFLISFLMLSQNVPSLYQDIRGEWDSGIVEAYLKGELDENGLPKGSAAPEGSSSVRRFPSYAPMGDNDTWLSYYDAETGFSCQYPTNWNKITGAEGLMPGTKPPMLKLANGANMLTVVVLDFETQKEFEHTRKLSLTLPRNAQGKPAEDYKQSEVNINGLTMTKTSNPLHIGAPDEPGEDIQQISLEYFQEDKRRIFSIVMHVFDEEAAADLDAISSSIQISQ